MEQSKKIAARYRKIQTYRNATIRSNIKTLIKSGYLYIKDQSEVDFLVSATAIIARFWISEAAVSLRHLNTEDQIQHYLSMIGRLLSSYVNSVGKKQVQKAL